MTLIDIEALSSDVTEIVFVTVQSLALPPRAVLLREYVKRGLVFSMVTSRDMSRHSRRGVQRLLVWYEKAFRKEATRAEERNEEGEREREERTLR
jgi:hypothetical protein